MKTALLFDFTVNRESKTIIVKREFAANRNLVWDAWTKPEILDQWWAPKPWRAITKTMHFNEGGYWLYCMTGPQNEQHWCRVDYKSIDAQQSYKTVDSFCDEEGNPNKDFASSNWANTFIENGNTTTVNIDITFNKLEDLETIIAMGFKEGFTMGLQNLEEYIDNQKKNGRKIIVLSHITLDGVMQAPGGPDEDPSDGFSYGGWSAPFGDESSGAVMQKQMVPADLLLGRKTFHIFASYWPQHADSWLGVNEVTKYVLSNTMQQSEWGNSVFLKSAADIANLKNTEGPDLKVWGSSKLVQLLLEHDLVDEFWLNVYPVVLGKGKKLFDGDPIPVSFKLKESHVTATGVIMTNYVKAGKVETGTIED